MTLQEMLQNYEDLLEVKEDLAAKTKENNKAIEAAKEEITNAMIDEDTPSMAVGDYNFSLASKTIYSKKSEAALQAAGLDFFTVLRQNGLGDIIKETVPAQTLNATCKAIVDEQEELPPELAQVLTVFETYDITRRKKRNAALAKAKAGKEKA